MSDRETSCVVCCVEFHVNLFIHDIFFGPLGLHIPVWSDPGGSWPFWPMRDLRMQWSRAFNLVCEMALSQSKEMTKKKQRPYQCTSANMSPLALCWSWCPVMQYMVLCLLSEVGFGVVLDYPFLLVGRRGFVCCQVFFYSWSSMWGIWWHFDVCFS